MQGGAQDGEVGARQGDEPDAHSGEQAARPGASGTMSSRAWKISETLMVLAPALKAALATAAFAQLRGTSQAITDRQSANRQANRGT